MPPYRGSAPKHLLRKLITVRQSLTAHQAAKPPSNHFFFGFSVFGFGGGPKSPYAINPERDESSFTASRPAHTSSLVSFAVLISYNRLPSPLPLVVIVTSPCKSVRKTFALAALSRSSTL